jgi:hypothetical protein
MFASQASHASKRRENGTFQRIFVVNPLDARLDKSTQTATYWSLGAAMLQALIIPACVPVAVGLKAGNGFLILAAVACCDLRMDDGVAICLSVGHDFDAGVRLDTCIDSIPA